MPKTATTVADLFPDKWLTPQHLQGKKVQTTISAVDIEELWQDQTKQKEPKIVLSFQGKTLRLPLNKTQAFDIATFTGIPVFKEWVGHTIQLAPAVARNKKPTIKIEAAPKPKPAPESRNRGAAQPVLEEQPTEPVTSPAMPIELGANNQLPEE